MRDYAESVPQRPPGTCLEERAPRASRSSVLIAVVGTLVIAAALNFAFLWILREYPQNPGYWLLRSKWDRLDQLAGPVDWLLLGDSSCNQGIISELLEPALGDDHSNLCTIGNMGLLDDAWMLDTYIDRFGAPETVLIVHVYDVWHRGTPPAGLLAQVPRSLGYWVHSTPRLNLTRGQNVDVFMARYVPLVGERRAIKALLRKWLPASRRPSATGDSGAEEAATDTSIQRVNQTAVRRDADRHRRFVAAANFATSEMNEAALGAIKSMAETHDFRVVIADSPLWNELAYGRGFQYYNAQVRESLRRFASRSDHISYLDSLRTYSISSMDRTVDHLRPEAAVRYTLWLAGALENIPAATP